MVIKSWFRGLRGNSQPRPVQAPAHPPQGYDLLFGQHATKVSSDKATKIVVIIGNCIAEEMEVGLSATPEATRHCRFFVVPMHLKKIGSSDVVALLGSASHVFLQKFAFDRFEEIRNKIPAGCEISIFPDVGMRSIWPFDEYNGLRDPKIDEDSECIFHNHDGALAALRLTIPDKRKRFEAYKALDFPAARRIEAVVAAQARHLTSVDENNDVHLGRFVSRHYRDMQLFYNSAHPSEVIFTELCQYCMRKLGLPDNVVIRGNISSWKAWSVPVHPRIAERLGLKWANEVTQYQYGSLGMVTWEQWVCAYIDTLG